MLRAANIYSDVALITFTGKLDELRARLGDRPSAWWPHLTGLAWRFAAIAFAIQALMCIFSLLGPVPINNRIIKWTPQSLPANWKTQESRWDLYHWFRTCCLIAAFALLTVSLGLR